MKRVKIGNCLLELRQGDITDEVVDMIVNAANSQLSPGGGVDGAIHRRGGPAIVAETLQKFPQGCATGSAVISAAGNLAARFVAHAVGPVWDGGNAGEPELLSGAFRRSLELAIEHDCRSVALPALSAGVYAYPLADAARVALTTVLEFLRQYDQPQLVRFVLFGPTAFKTFANVLAELAGPCETISD
ncbi:MAG TPA: macro domain-containing protein [Pirellulales bacterium]|jgi:O-acetyl-ADP-ribose deacetylase (regulator of RNase III)